jgi:hypothetical protein
MFIALLDEFKPMVVRPYDRIGLQSLIERVRCITHLGCLPVWSLCFYHRQGWWYKSAPYLLIFQGVVCGIKKPPMLGGFRNG